VESQVPEALEELVEQGANEISGVPNSATDLGGDLLVSFGKQLTGGIDGPALTLLIIGALLFGASFFAFLIGPLLLPITMSRMLLRILGIFKLPFRRGGEISSRVPDATSYETTVDEVASEAVEDIGIEEDEPPETSRAP